MTEKRFIPIFDMIDKRVVGAKDNGVVISFEDMFNLLNELHEENEQLKKNRFICLDCEHSGYAEIGCLCEYNDHWVDFKSKCEDFKELWE